MPNEVIGGQKEMDMEKQTVVITIKTEGETCEMSDAEIKAWYETNVAKLFDPAYGTPKITVELTREECLRR